MLGEQLAACDLRGDGDDVVAVSYSFQVLCWIFTAFTAPKMWGGNEGLWTEKSKYFEEECIFLLGLYTTQYLQYFIPVPHLIGPDRHKFIGGELDEI